MPVDQQLATNLPYKKEAYASDDLIYVEFTEDYDPETVDDTTFSLFYRDQTGAEVAVEGDVEQDARNKKKAKFIPKNDLKAGVWYTIKILNGIDGVQGVSGGSLCTVKEWRFSTIPSEFPDSASAYALFSLVFR